MKFKTSSPLFCFPKKSFCDHSSNQIINYNINKTSNGRRCHFWGDSGRVVKCTGLKLWCFWLARCGYKSWSWHFVDPESRWVHGKSFWMFKCFDPDSVSKCSDPDSGSIEMTRIPGQLKWPGFRVNANDPDSGSMQMTRIPGQFKWPGFWVNANDPDSGSKYFDPESEHSKGPSLYPPWFWVNEMSWPELEPTPC